MQYAIVSDIHANLQAWNAVLLDIRSLGLDSIICLGDIVGYGPCPAETLKSVHTNVDHLVLGNHDAVIANKMDASLFNEKAHDIIQWTRSKLNHKAIRFLETLPLTLRDSFFRCSHGDFSNPAAFHYVFDPEDASPSWAAVDEEILFAGHTHTPAIFVLGRSKTPRIVAPQDFEIEPEKRYLVNVGSVGQPRNREPRACYAILDTETMVVSWRIIPFDLDAFAASLSNANMPTEAGDFLDFDPRNSSHVRESVDFSPPQSETDQVQDTLEVCEIVQLKTAVTLWKRVTLAAALGLVALLVGAGAILYNRSSQELDLVPTAFSARPVWTSPADSNVLMTPSNTVEPGQPVPHWHIHLGNQRKQSVGFEAGHNNKPYFKLNSSVISEIRLTSPTLGIRPGNKFCFETLFRKGRDFRGNIAVVISLHSSDGEYVDQFIVKEPNLPRKGGWMLAKKTFTSPANAEAITFSIRGAFKGQVEIRQPAMCRRE